MKRKKQQKGFTLIEMLVVIVIIGILASLIAVSVAGARRKALAVQAKADVESVFKAINMAASEGCSSINVSSGTPSATGGLIKCSVPSTLTSVYGSIPVPPVGLRYDLVIGATTVYAVGNASGTPANPVAGTTTAQSLTGEIKVTASSGATGLGFDPVNTATFSCSSGSISVKPGCYCSAPDGCNSIK